MENMSDRHNWHRRRRATSTTTELSLPRAHGRLLAAHSVERGFGENLGARWAASAREECAEQKWLSAHSFLSLAAPPPKFPPSLMTLLAGLAHICRLSCQASIIYKSIFIIYLTPPSNSVDCVLRLSSLFLESFWIMKVFSFYLFTFITFCLLQSGKWLYSQTCTCI